MRYVEIDPAAIGPQRVTRLVECETALEGEQFIEVTERPAVGAASWYDVQIGDFVDAPPPPAPTADELCQRIDTTADSARRAVAGDPLRAVEYDRAASEAQAFAATGYQGEVPPMVAAWAINGRTAQQAADDILREAAQYNGALVQLRTVRLQAKELIRAAMADGNVELAQDIAAETIASIEAAVAGIGNNAS